MQVATKWEYRTTIAFAWLTSEWMISTDARLVSQPSKMVTQRGEFCRILLVSPSPLHGVELLEGWSSQRNRQRDCWPCQLVHCILNETTGRTKYSVPDQPLDRIRSGWFDVICLLPAAATWSRAGHFGDGQKPLRSRAEPFGLQSLGPSFNFESYGIEPAIENLLSGSSKKRSRARQRKSGSYWFFQKTSVEAWILDRPRSGHYKNSNHFKALQGGGPRGASTSAKIGPIRPHETSWYLLKI